MATKRHNSVLRRVTIKGKTREPYFRKKTQGRWYADIVVKSILIRQGVNGCYYSWCPDGRDSVVDEYVATQINGRIAAATLKMQLRNRVQKFLRERGFEATAALIRFDLVRNVRFATRFLEDEKASRFGYIWGVEGQGSYEVEVSGSLRYPDDIETNQFCTDYDPRISKAVVAFSEKTKVNPGDVVMFALARMFTEFKIEDMSELVDVYGVLSSIRSAGMGVPKKGSVFAVSKEVCDEA